MTPDIDGDIQWRRKQRNHQTSNWPVSSPAKHHWEGLQYRLDSTARWQTHHEFTGCDTSGETRTNGTKLENKRTAGDSLETHAEKKVLKGAAEQVLLPSY